MAAGGPGISVGDAVLNFVGDTTQLDQAFSKVGAEAASKLAPVQAAADQVGNAISQAGAKAQQATSQMVTGFQAVTREGQTWANFFKVNMPAAVAYTGSATEAMKLLGAEWKRFQASQTDGFHVITREGQLWAGFFKTNIDQAIKYTGSATAAMKLLEEEWTRLRAETAQPAVFKIETSGATGFDAAAIKAQTAQAAESEASAVTAANDKIATSEKAVAEAVEATGVTTEAAGVQVAQSATLWSRLVAVMREVTGSSKAVQAELAQTGTASSAAAIALEHESEAYRQLAVAQLESSEANQAVQNLLRQISTGEIPKTTQTIDQLAIAQQRAAEAAHKLALSFTGFGEGTGKIREAKGEMMLLNEELGLGVSRHIAAFIAKLPVVGELLEAAFSATAVLIVIQLIGEAAEKLEDFNERQEKIKQAWVGIDEEFARTTDGIDQGIDAQEQKFIELTEGPVAALDFALKHMKSTAEDTLQSITSEAQKAGQQLKSENSLRDFFEKFSPKEASKDLTAFTSELTETMRKAKEEAPKDLFAQYRAGLKLTEDQIDKLNTNIEEIEASIKATQDQQRLHGGIIDTEAAEQSLVPLKKELDIIRQIQTQLGKGTEEDKVRAKAEKEARDVAAAQRAQELGDAKVDAEKTTGDAILALQREQNSEYYQQGSRSFAQYIALVRKYSEDEYSLNKDSLQRKLALIEADPTKNAAAIITTNGQLRALETQHQTDLLKIDEDTYRKQASDSAAAIQVQIAGTKQGSQERINLEQVLSQFLKVTWGEESEAYKASLTKIAEAERQHKDQLARLAQEESRNEQQLFEDRQQANAAFLQYQLQTNRANQAEILRLQHELDTAGFNQRRADLVRQITALGADELDARVKLQGQLDLLDQQHVEKERAYRRQLADVQDSYFSELGIKSEGSVERQVEIEQQAFDKIKASGTASYAEILRAKEALLNNKISLAQLVGDETEFQKLTAELGEVENALYKMGVQGSKTYTSLNAGIDAFVQRLQKERGELHGSQAVFNTVMLDMTNVMGNAVQAWILGQASLGNALRQGLAAELATIAGKAAAWALYFTAWGIADLFWNPARAGADFTAAAEFAAVAALAGASAYAIRPNNKDNSSATAVETTQASGITQGPTQATTQRLGSGGIVSKRQFVQIGDNPAGTADAREAVIPLESPDALRQIASAIGPHVQAALLSSPVRERIEGAQQTVNNSSRRDSTTYQGDEVHHYYDMRKTEVAIEGVISSDNLSSVVRRINHLVKNNDVPLTASNALRVTKRS